MIKKKKDQRKQRNECDLILTTYQVFLLLVFRLILTMNLENECDFPILQI